MLGKLFKYEMRATGRIFLPTYLVLLAFAILTRFSLSVNHFDFDRVSDLAAIFMTTVIAGYVLAIFGVFIVAFVVIIQRFYKNLTGDEGYLMFTLPVNTWELVTSKLLSALVWQLVTAAAVVVSLCILLFRLEYLPDMMDAFRWFWREINMEIGVNLAAFILEMLLLMVLGAVQGTLMIYASIAIGHTIHKHRVLGAVGAYIGLSVAIQFASSIAMLPLGLTSFRTDWYSMNPTAAFHMIMLASAILCLIVGAILFFITTYILGRQLNLE